MLDKKNEKNVERKSPREDLLAYLEKRIKELENEEKKFRKYALGRDTNRFNSDLILKSF